MKGREGEEGRKREGKRGEEEEEEERLCHCQFMEDPVKYLDPQYRCLPRARPAGHGRNCTQEFREAWLFFSQWLRKNASETGREEKKKKNKRQEGIRGYSSQR